MIFKRFILIVVLTLLILPAIFAEGQNPKEESDQQINDFSLAGYGEKGKKTWDLSGKSADIFTQVIALKDVVGNLYGKKEDIRLTADKGDFNKVDGKIHLEQNVVITTSGGTKLVTDSLDWDRKLETVATKDSVNIQRENMVVEASGARGEPNLKKVVLEKDVKLNIMPQEKDKAMPESSAKEKITITCDGPLEIDYEKNTATFNNKVKVEREGSEIFSDKMDVFFIASGTKGKDSEFMGSRVDKIIASGNVRIVQGENVSYSEGAIYNAIERKITLTGRPKLVIYSSGDFKDASSGN